MTDIPSDAGKQLRWSIYAILIALSVGQLTGDIFAVNSTDKVKLEGHRIKQKLSDYRKRQEEKGLTGEELEQKVAEKQLDYQTSLRLQRPFLSSNDRSRWANVRALVEHGTFAIDDVIAEPNWDTIDMVKHKDRDGEEHLYSSKPPLLATIIAGEYWVLHQLTGWTLGSHPYVLGRGMLLTINVIPLAIMFTLIAAMAERLARTDFARILVVATAAMATFLTAFGVVLNNHIPAAVSVTVALYAVVRILHDGENRARWFWLAGIFAAFAAACDLPALSFTAIVGAILLWRAPRQTLLGFLPGMLVVAAAFFGTNYLAHASWRPPYAHRSETDPEDNWYDYSYTVNGRERESYWRDPNGIDRGEPDVAKYAWHVLIGHHGVFSLSPIWMLSMFGAAVWLFRGSNISDHFGRIESKEPATETPSPPLFWSSPRFLGATTLLLTIVCFVFYIGLRPQQDRNYGGMTGGFRWMFWCIPLWLVSLLPAGDIAARNRTLRWVTYILLAASVVSVAYLNWNPWRLPWLTEFFIYMGWEKF